MKTTYVCRNCGETYPYQPVYCNECGVGFGHITFKVLVDGVQQTFSRDETIELCRKSYAQCDSGNGSYVDFDEWVKELKI